MDTYRKFTKATLAWYKRYGRDLPWRNTQDPYHIFVSECMLQQTQVSRVIPKYEAFLQAFPTVTHLANASLRDVIVLWSGLGYNRRAKYLWQAANVIVKTHSGHIPDDPQKLEQLPGFGAYSANAIAAFAFNKPVVVIDANIKRVFNYVFGLEQSEIANAVARCVPKNHSRDFYNALMDIGSLYYKSTSTYETYPYASFCFFYNKKSIPPLKKVKQKSFKDSDRFYRGQILKQLVQAQELDAATLNKDTRYAIALSQLCEEGLVMCEKNRVFLPKSS
ncbi:MAG: hypothetical protein ACMXYF_00220 [Candidatus Woesearchaeota archaeon]